jgi:hypothetical protein
MSPFNRLKTEDLNKNERRDVTQLKKRWNLKNHCVVDFLRVV